MKLRRLVLTLALAIVAAILMATYFREPRYRGRTLSAWLRESQVKWTGAFQNGEESVTYFNDDLAYWVTTFLRGLVSRQLLDGTV